MSAANSIARQSRDAEQAGSPAAFELPPELAARYDVRVVDGADGAQRLGLFRPGDRTTPSIEIVNDRITARSEDPETVSALVKIAQANGWDRITVDGSVEFRKAVWTAATREGLSVSGYDASFAELEDRAKARSAAPTQASPSREDAERNADTASAALSDDDRRLLLTLSRHTEDRKGLYEAMRPETDAFQREVQYERIDANRAALADALERALESPTLGQAFARSGYEPETLRQSGNAGEWDGKIADAIYLVRSGLHRDTLADRDENVAALADAIDGEREDRAVAVETDGPRLRSEEPRLAREREERSSAGHRDSEELAELFLHGAAERLAADPRLATAMRAQHAMDEHIGEVFRGDEIGGASASLESRQLIADALRRGLDVTVRDPTPVRQIEPIQVHAELER
ncbi:LPD7 domain-containing protein [Sphingomonas sp.]|uniref:LPD7 domain-containing protein n=1 Tax=Sphingomonas sp. TaxID=28214 RepID=UPI000DB3323A|nr:LPD7 domain-containing protein [Sphingomonas sp.]PZU06506.1 MAG: hypothetical protein DI605_18840 [Sphingomonas sp.]